MTTTIPCVSGDQDWRDNALCRQVDPELCFPDKGQNATDAKRVCFACEVRVECLADAMVLPSWRDQYGVRGGLSARERDTLRKQAAA